MILRRIASAFKQQDWATVTIEFVLVVTGVLVALQIDTWNEQRKNQALERTYLKRLQGDLDRSKAGIQERLEDMNKSREEAMFVIEALEACSLYPEMEDRFATALFRLGKLSPPTMIDTTLTEMQSTGTLDVLSEPGLIQTLIELQRHFAVAATNFRSVELWNAGQLAVVHSRVRFNFRDMRAGFGVVSGDELSLDLEEACQDVAMMAAISSLKNYAAEMAEWNQSSLIKVDGAREVVESALDKKMPGWVGTP